MSMAVMCRLVRPFSRGSKQSVHDQNNLGSVELPLLDLEGRSGWAVQCSVWMKGARPVVVRFGVSVPSILNILYIATKGGHPLPPRTGAAPLEPGLKLCNTRMHGQR